MYGSLIGSQEIEICWHYNTNKKYFCIVKYLATGESYTDLFLKWFFFLNMYYSMSQVSSKVKIS